jgi:hypothetical protein
MLVLLSVPRPACMGLEVMPLLYQTFVTSCGMFKYAPRALTHCESTEAVPFRRVTTWGGLGRAVYVSRDRSPGEPTIPSNPRWRFYPAKAAKAAKDPPHDPILLWCSAGPHKHREAVTHRLTHRLNEAEMRCAEEEILPAPPRCCAGAFPSRLGPRHGPGSTIAITAVRMHGTSYGW